MENIPIENISCEKKVRWLLPVLLILFILVVATLPMMIGLTYSGRSDDPDHVLTYTKGQLQWDAGSSVDSDGAAIMDLFDAEYTNVKSDDGRDIVAPGTDGHSFIRLKNNVDGQITYTAVLYRIRTDEDLKVNVSLEGEYQKANKYTLPEGVTTDMVVQAVTGTVKGREAKDFDIVWDWAFYENDEQDAKDTALGVKAQTAPDRVTVGVYIVVEDNNSYGGGGDLGSGSGSGGGGGGTSIEDCLICKPKPPLAAPKGGSMSRLAPYAALIAIAEVVMVSSVVDQRKKAAYEAAREDKRKWRA